MKFLDRDATRHLMETYEFFPLYVDRSGIGFWYKGDEVILLWPWKRRDFRRPWLSISFEGTYRSLPDLDREWERFFDAERRSALYAQLLSQGRG